MHKYWGGELFMKKYLYITVLLTLFTFLLTGCSKKTTEASTFRDFSYEGTVFTYDGKNYDLSEQTNAILDVKTVGDFLLIEGHISPQNSYYGIFNPTTLSFDTELFGTNLIYYNDDLKTSVYAIWSDLYNYEGNLIGNCDLQESEFVSQLAFINDNSQIEATISNTENDRTEVFDLKK